MKTGGVGRREVQDCLVTSMGRDVDHAGKWRSHDGEGLSTDTPPDWAPKHWISG